MDFFSRALYGENLQNFTPIPGLFPEQPQPEANTGTRMNPPDNRPSSEPEENEGERTTSRFSLSYILYRLAQLPLFLLYYILLVLTVLVDLIKPLIDFGRMYDSTVRHPVNHAVNMQALLKELTLESNSNASVETAHMTTYNFGSLYNLETGALGSANLLCNSYTELLEESMKQCKFGIIYLHDPMLDNPMRYVDNILCTAQFVDMVRKYQVLLWFGNVETSEGMQVANALKVRQFPFLGLLCQKSQNKIEVIARAEGSVRRYSGRKFERLMASHNDALLEMLERRQNIEMERLIREQQNARYMTSLRRDQERDRQRAEARERERLAAEQARLKRQYLLWRRQTLHPEPTNTRDVSKVAIRLANGSRVVRKFDPNLPVEEIYAFVELVQNDLISSSGDTATTSRPPAGYVHTYQFRLITPVPRHVLDPSSRIGDEPNIYPSGNIVMEEMGDE